MPTRKVPGRPMEKWCRDCLQFRPNPENKKNPMYCPDCLELRWIIRLETRKRNILLKKDKQKQEGLNTN